MGNGPKQLKSVRNAAAPAPAAVRHVVSEASRSLAAAVPRRGRRTVPINVKVAEESAIALAKQAAAEGITQNQFICRALAAAGVPMDPLGLEDRTPRRRVEAA
jgi:hypothetical protein